MDKTNKQPYALERFYNALDEKTVNSLTDEQKQALEKAVLDITLTTRHRVDIRRTFPLFARRYYMVFLLGRDLRRRPREESSPMHRLVVSLLVLLAILVGLGSIFIALYLFKSALGIDIFPKYHLGLWDWLMKHRQ